VTFAGSGNQMPMLHGSLVATLSNAVGAFSGFTGQGGALIATLANATASFAGKETFSGTLAPALGNMAMVANGKETFAGTVNGQLDDASFAGGGTLAITGTFAAQLGNATSNIQGISSSAVGPLITTLADFGMVVEALVPMDAIPFMSGYWITHLRREHQR
jgi:hypothetical protein